MLIRDNMLAHQVSQQEKLLVHVWHLVRPVNSMWSLGIV